MALIHPLRSTPRVRMRTLHILLAVSLAVAGLAGWQWWRLLRDDALAATGEVTKLPLEQVMGSPTLRFARARELATANDFEGALALYRTLYADVRLGVTARYNSANLLVRQAQQLRDSDGEAQAVALLELAKQGYREVLRRHPHQWDARYNFERAQRLQPDPEEDTAAIGGPRNDAERAAITIRGVPQGLP